MESKSNHKMWIALAAIFGAILILVIGYFIGQALKGNNGGGPAGDKPRNPPASGAVTVQSFSLEPDRIKAGECTTLSWQITNAELVTLSRDGEPIYNALMVDQYKDCLDQTGVYRFRLDASNSDGQFYNWSELQVIVE